MDNASSTYITHYILMDKTSWTYSTHYIQMNRLLGHIVPTHYLQMDKTSCTFSSILDGECSVDAALMIYSSKYLRHLLTVMKHGHTGIPLLQ